MDPHPTGNTSHHDSRDLIHRSRKLRDSARHLAERAVNARSCFGPPPLQRDDAKIGAARLISVAQNDRYVLVEVRGAIDVVSCNELADVLTRAVDSRPPAVIVDLSAVTLLSAAGLRCLELATEQASERGGSLHVVCPADRPANRILGLFAPYARQPRHTDVAAAVRSIMRP